jgi:hypothetical protein
VKLSIPLVTSSFSNTSTSRLRFSGDSTPASANDLGPAPRLLEALKPHDGILEMPIFVFAHRLFDHSIRRLRAFQDTVEGQQLQFFVRDNHGLSALSKETTATDAPITLTTRGTFKPKRTFLEPVPTLSDPANWHWKASTLKREKSADPLADNPVRGVIFQDVKGPTGQENMGLLFSMLRGDLYKGGLRHALRLNRVPVQRETPRVSDPKLERPFFLRSHGGVQRDNLEYRLVTMMVPATAEYAGFKLSSLQQGLGDRHTGLARQARIRVSLLPALAKRLRLGEPSITPPPPKKTLIYDGPIK